MRALKRNLIIQFAKYPQLGKVKTRLAKTLGDNAALNTHIELTLNVLNNLTSANLGTVELCFDQLLANREGQGLVEVCRNKSVSVSTQHGNDLGERMYHALFSRLKSFDKVIIVGSDCPTVDKAYLINAIDALNSNDLVMGPAEDGGYVLLGASKVKSTMLDNIEWGCGEVLRSTVSNAEQLGLSYALLDTTWDVDDYEDYMRWKE
jgi:rSAM/selenodomain-associated transferase 1